MQNTKLKKKAIVLSTTVLLSVLLIGILPFHVTAADPTLVYIDPPTKTVSANQTFNLTVACIPGQPMKAYELSISYDPDLLTANSVTNGTIFNGYPTFFNDGTINNNAGHIINIYELIQGPGLVSSPGTLVIISFTAKLTSGTTTIDLYHLGVTNETHYLPLSVTNGTVTLQEYILNVTIDGSGSVTTTPDLTTYPYGQVVTLTAIPDENCLFTSWTGDLTGNTNPTTLTMNANKTVTAHFVDAMAPQISNITLTTSDPLDTNASYGWVNISCNITDNINVSQTMLQIQNPNGSWNNASMTTIHTDEYYYDSTTAFSTAGNYSYQIWAQDNDGNNATSLTMVFSMPPNWDINIDGTCDIMDFVMISNHYSETGTQGWIREDVNNNGEITVLDLVLVSNHFGESWW